MRQVPIDFAQSRRALGWPTLVIFLLGLGCAGWVGHEGWQLTQQRLGRTDRLAQLRERAMQAATQSQTVSLSEQQITAINQAVDALNLPWDTLFNTLEAPRYREVALLALLPDREQGTLKIQAEAKSPAEMVGYLRNLQKEPCFSDVILVHHEINDQDPNKPIRFTVEATWRAV